MNSKPGCIGKSAGVYANQYDVAHQPCVQKPALRYENVHADGVHRLDQIAPNNRNVVLDIKHLGTEIMQETADKKKQDKTSVLKTAAACPSIIVEKHYSIAALECGHGNSLVISQPESHGIMHMESIQGLRLPVKHLLETDGGKL